MSQTFLTLVTCMKGRVLDNILYKDLKKTKKFFKYDGYGINTADLHEVLGVVIETKYDGKLYTSVSNLEENGIPWDFNGERQLILPVKFWRNVR